MASMAIDDGQAAKVAKLQKKLAKAQKGGDNELIDKLQSKLAKLQKSGAGDSEPAAQGNGAGSASELTDSGKKSKKRKKQEAGGTDNSAGETNGTAAPPSSSKKQKKQKAALADDSAADGAELEAEASTKKSKKAKKQAPIGGVVVRAGDVDLNACAEVGDSKLAASGKHVVKDLFKPHSEVAAMTPDEVAQLRQQRQTTVEGVAADSDRFKPYQKFQHTGLPANMLHATRDFQAPSPIQAQCWPIILSGRDLIGIAATGSGKTLGFGLPMLAHIAAQKESGVVSKSGKGPYAVVMAPTRELALQINQVLVDAGSSCGVRCVCVYGGVPKKEQQDALRRGVEVVVGTPGRLEDLMQEGTCKLNEVTYLVLDEADRMLDLGFEPHIRAIANTIRADRQTLMFSATWPAAVQKLAAAFLTAPIKVTIGSQDLAASHSITQHVEVIEPFARDDRLLQLLQKYHSSHTNRVIIFVLYKKEAPRVESLLNRRGWKCCAIHGDISQAQRTAAVESFKSGKVPLLIATDVAARGLDIPDVEVVLNYSFPLTTEDYVHRIGRTGRAGKTGVAHTFFCAGPDKPRAGELINVLREAGQKVPDELLKFGTAVKKKESKLYGAHFKDVDFTAKATKMTFGSDDDE